MTLMREPPPLPVATTQVSREPRRDLIWDDALYWYGRLSIALTSVFRGYCEFAPVILC